MWYTKSNLIRIILHLEQFTQRFYIVHLNSRDKLKEHVYWQEKTIPGNGSTTTESSLINWHRFVALRQPGSQQQWRIAVYNEIDKSFVNSLIKEQMRAK